MAISGLQLETLEGFLLALQTSGKISSDDYSRGLALVRKTQIPLDDFVIPGTITLRKACAFGELAAAAAVFNTPELAENIFSHLSSQDLANNVALTCHGFHNYVHSSPGLRRQLFLEPEKSTVFDMPRCPKLKNVHYCFMPGLVDILVTKLQDMIERYPRLSSTYILQPPPTTLEVSYETTAGHVDASLVQDERGITYGVLWTAISKHMQQWQRGKAALSIGPLRVIEAHLICRAAGKRNAPH